MTKLFQTTIVFIFTFIFSNIIEAQQFEKTKFEVIKTEKLKLHVLLTVTNNNDTIMVVTKNTTSKRMVQSKLYKLNYKSCPTVCELEDDGKKIVFIYKNEKATIGCGSPGIENVRYINSYKSFPIVLENCN